MPSRPGWGLGFDRRGRSAYRVQLFHRSVIQLQFGRLDKIGQVLVIGCAGNGSGYSGLHHQPSQRYPPRGRVVLLGNLVQRVKNVKSPVI